MIDAVEGNAIPVNRFKGEIFCSRYGLDVDAYTDREGNKALFDVLFLIDGTRSEAENPVLQSASGFRSPAA